MEMSQVNEDDLEEKPLDPEMEKVRRKMVRLLAVSIGIMFIGLMTVLGAIVYKFTQDDAGKQRRSDRGGLDNGSAGRCADRSRGSPAAGLRR
jgi:hypothetical protein